MRVINGEFTPIIGKVNLKDLEIVGKNKQVYVYDNWRDWLKALGPVAEFNGNECFYITMEKVGFGSKQTFFICHDKIEGIFSYHTNENVAKDFTRERDAYFKKLGEKGVVTKEDEIINSVIKILERENPAFTYHDARKNMVDKVQKIYSKSSDRAKKRKLDARYTKFGLPFPKYGYIKPDIIAMEREGWKISGKKRKFYEIELERHERKHFLAKLIRLQITQREVCFIVAEGTVDYHFELIEEFMLALPDAKFNSISLGSLEEFLEKGTVALRKL